MSNILFELGCEELPPKSLLTLRDALKTSVEAQLTDAGFNFTQINAFAAPRRLALQIIDIDLKQPDRVEQKRGPDVTRAFDAEGKPTGAAIGFAKGAGVEVSDLGRLETDKGTYLMLEEKIAGESITAALPLMLQKALDTLPIAKRMRSGSSRTTFVRPVKWVVLMLDDQLIEANIQSINTARTTLGHRFHAPDAFEVSSADSYFDQLKAAYVMVDFEERRSAIQTQVNLAAQAIDGVAVMPDDLLSEVTALVAWPVTLTASFESRFLAVPQEALITTMQDNQKYFCVVDQGGKLLPNFIFVTNIESKDPKQIIEGNEKVVRPRLADAEFFFEQDQKTPLAMRSEQLKNRVFQDKLGTLWDKSERIARLAAAIAVALKATHAIDVDQVTKAALLSKCDLASLLVGEFPDLQGTAGKYYAALEGESDELAAAIEEQYLPKGAGDALPLSLTGMCLALADRVDTLVGIFAIGELPSGSKDPFSLRRAAIGVLRILIENKLPLNLVSLIDAAIAGYAGRLEIDESTRESVLEFIEARYRAYYESRGVSIDSIQAVQALRPHMPLDFDERLLAIEAFRLRPEALALAAANKRVAGILAKAETSTGVDPALFEQAEETALHSALGQFDQRISNERTRSYSGTLSELAQLHGPIEAFFESVMVNSDDPKLKANRMALLSDLRARFLSVADISLLQPAETA